MKPQRPSIDGFVPRRSSSQLGDRHSQRPAHARNPKSTKLDSHTAPHTDVPVDNKNPLQYSNQGLMRRDIDESLNSIVPDEYIEKKPKWNLFRRRKIKAPVSRRKKIIKWVCIVFVTVLLLAGAWLAYRTLVASGNIFKGNILGLVQNAPLKEDANGRSNILILGTSDDDPGHGGAYLTDSMMIVSIDQKNKSTSMFSIPRDLYVNYERPCNSGFEGKINEYFNCVNDDYSNKDAQEQRMTETRKFIGKIFDMDVQYAVNVNNTVIKDAVNAVGGIEVDIQGSNGDPGILDRNFDWRCNYTCHLVKYDNGVHHLDGERALFLAMARGHIAPTYGLGNSNFDREKNQQKILVALKEKAVSTGTLSDLSKVTGLIDTLGDNLRTNFETSEIRTLMQLGTEINVDNIQSLSLFEDENAVVKTGNYNGASIVMPVAGIFDYSGIRTYLRQKLSNNPMTREGAGIVVLNGSGVAGVALEEANKLEKAGFVISDVNNAPTGTYETVEIYQIGEGKTATKEKLESTFATKIKVTPPPITVNKDVNFIVIFGEVPTED